MDALQQHPLRFTRPPMLDPQHHQQHPPTHAPWGPSQFQFQPSPSHHFPHSHHPPPQQWIPHSSDQSMPPFSHPFQPPAPHSYSSSTSTPPPYPPYHHFPPPRSLAPPPPPQSQLYGQPDQTWGNPNWARHQGWEYPDNTIPHSNEDDWAAKARAWAAANAARDNQNTQLQFAPVGRIEEQNHAYHDHYQQSVGPYFTDVQQSSLPPLSHHQQPLPVSMPDTQMPLSSHLQETASFNAGPPSYAPDGALFYGAKDGSLASDVNPIPGPPQGSTHSRSSIYQQEVPSSYSSFPGNNEENGSADEQSHLPLRSPVSSVQGQFHPQHSLPAGARSVSVEPPHFVYGTHSVEDAIDASDQPLNFEHGSARDQDTRHLPGYAHPDHPVPIGGLEHVTAVSSVHAWTPPVAPGIAFPPIPPGPSGPQFDPPFFPPLPIPGHPTPMYGRIPGPTFGANIPPVTAPFGIGTGTPLHPAAVFPGDANGGFSVSERPKKASVPNWLKEELIKKKAAVIASSSVQDHPADVLVDSTGIESADNFYRNVDQQADSKSVDSVRSIKDEDDDEDDVEAARSLAINQEIKRVLTEVLLKVTDELFEEIATKVLAEDDLTVEAEQSTVDHSTVPAVHKSSPSPPAVPAGKASAMILIPVKIKDAKNEDASEKSNSSSPGDVLGLGNYASDDDEIQSSGMVLAKRRNGVESQQLSGGRGKGNRSDGVEKGLLQAEIEEKGGDLKDTETDANKSGINDALRNHRSLDDDVRAMTRKTPPIPEIEKAPADAKVVSPGINEGKVTFSVGRNEEPSQGRTNAAIPRPAVSDSNDENTTDDSQDRYARKSSSKNGHRSKKSDSISKSLGKDIEDDKTKADHRHAGSGVPSRRENRDVSKEKTDERNRVKERVKDRGDKSGEKMRSSDRRKSSNHASVREDKKETEKARSGGMKEDGNRKRDRGKDEKEDRSKHRDSRDSHRSKRHRSSSASSRGKNGKDNLSGSFTSGSSDETSDISRHRKRQSKRRSLSPSPVRSRRRQVSRSPLAKNSQRRHSPYSSLERRGRRSRSISPNRRRR